jgi:ubiquinone/menaquinone biosynthesis C-methylase UbiE
MNWERWADLEVSRPFVLADTNHLPFADKAFDFVVASHVLEHSTDPARFLDELQRVARAGYIETPHAFLEQIIPYGVHSLIVGADGNRLIITKKPEAIPNARLYKDFYAQVAPSRAFRKFYKDNNDLFFLCFCWNE